MKKEKLFIGLLNIIISMILTLGIVYTYIQVNIYTTPPYSLSSNAISFSVMPNMYYNQPTLTDEELNNALYNLLVTEDIVFISDDIARLGLGILDPINYYKKFGLTDGIYQLNYNEKNCLLSEELYKLLPPDNHIFTTLNQNELNITGIYNKEYPLYQSDKIYIYNFFDDPSLEGYFYIDHPNRQHLETIYNNQLSNLLTTNGYTVELYQTYSNNYFKVFLCLFKNPTYIFTIFLIIYCFLNLCLFYFHISNHFKQSFKVHIRVGGTLTNVSRVITLKLFNYIFYGSILGTLIYSVIFSHSNLKVTFYIALCSIILNTIISWISLFIVFLLRIKLLLPEKGDFLHD